VGETFSGVDFEAGLRAAEELKAIVPQGATLAQIALRWILMFDAVTCAIPGAKRPEQVDENLKAAMLSPLSTGTMNKVQETYNRLIRPQMHARY
jgi:aryl-alcohol dehydrogenase-like predicted oxidoreductase